MARETIAGWKATAQRWKDTARRHERTIRRGKLCLAGTAVTCSVSLFLLCSLLCGWVTFPAPIVTVQMPAPSAQQLRNAPRLETPTADVSPARVLASVRIGRSGGCSGTIIARDGEKAYGLSAGHCCSGLQQEFVFWNPDGTKGNARWIKRDRSLDLALFICWSKDTLGHVCVPKDAVPNWKEPVYGIGYPSGQGPKQKRLKYVKTHSHGEKGTRKLFRARYSLQNIGGGRSGGGDSGGGVFYDGYLVGVMTHGNSGVYGHNAASLPQIQAFLAGTVCKGFT